MARKSPHDYSVVTRIALIVAFVAAYLLLVVLLPFGQREIDDRNVVIAVGITIMLAVMWFRPR